MQRVLLVVAASLFGLCARPTRVTGQDKPVPLSIDTVDLAFSKITINDGLSQGMVGTIAQDRHGFMWFGTKDGLNRYDGYTFTVFRHDAGDTNSVRESTISGLHCDRHGRLWVGTATGLDLFDERTERFVHLPIHHPKGDWGGVVHIVMDDNGDLWVSSTQSLVKLTFASPFTGFDPPTFTTTWYGDGYATISRTRDGRLLGQHERGHLPHHPATRRIRCGGYDRPDRLRQRQGAIRCALRGGGHGARQALRHLRERHRGSGSGHRADHLPDPGPQGAELVASVEPGDRQQGHDVVHHVPWALPLRPRKEAAHLGPHRRPGHAPLHQHAEVGHHRPHRHALAGHHGLWIAEYDPRIERFNHWPTGSVRALAPTNDDQLLVSHYDSYLTVFDPALRRNTLTIRGVAERWPDIGAQLLTRYADMTVQDRDGMFWSFISYGTLSRFDPSTGALELLTPEISPGVKDGGFNFPLHFGIDGALWCGGDKALWRIDPRTKVCTPHPWPVPVVNNPYPFTTALHHGTDGVLWVGTVKGLLRFDPIANTWKSYGHDAKDSTSLSVETVFSICPDPTDPLNVLWIGTNGGGVNRFDVRTGRSTRFTTRQGLPNDVVYGVLSDDLGHLWMSTNKGIARFDPRTNTFRNFNAGDGLQSDEFNRHAYCKDRKGWLYFGGVSGFNYFDPHALEQDSTPVVVRITGIRLINKPVEFGAPGSPLQLPVHLSTDMEIPYSANMVTFSFAAMEYAAPELHEYRYMLEGFDADWIDAGKDNSAVYTNLDPGNYTFRVRGRNRDGIWDDRGTSFTLTVQPPWWRTGWFYALCGIVIIGGTLLYIRSLRVQRLMLERTVADRTRELKHEKDRSEELLKNILPENVANELKVRGAAEARYFDQVTVLFSDFKEFTRVSELLSAAELVEELNVCFNAFDRIMEKYGVEKIKTIGDAYMAAGGVPDPSGGMPLAVVLAGLEMQQIMRERQAERRAMGKPTFEMRLGIHTGPVVAGIVGRRKFAYDIWGDTVNIASRMETTGEPGEVNISSATHALVKDAPELRFTPRGMVSAKGKGEMEMFYVYARSIQAIVDAEPVKREPITAKAPAELIAEDAAPANDVATSPALSNLRILLAEDNEFNAMVAQGHLENWLPHAKLTHVLNGTLAVEAVRSGAYDVVLMDIQMPEMNGYDAAKAIRALSGDKSRIAIIAMSANVMKAEIDRCSEAGMNAFVPKPYKKEQLLEAIEKVMNTDIQQG